MTKIKKRPLLQGRGRRPTYPFRDLKEVGDSFQVDCAGMSAEQKKRKRENMSTLGSYYGRKLHRTFGTEITGDSVTVQLTAL